MLKIYYFYSSHLSCLKLVPITGSKSFSDTTLLGCTNSGGRRGLVLKFNCVKPRLKACCTCGVSCVWCPSNAVLELLTYWLEAFSDCFCLPWPHLPQNKFCLSSPRSPLTTLMHLVYLALTLHILPLSSCFTYWLEITFLYWMYDSKIKGI